MALLVLLLRYELAEMHFKVLIELALTVAFGGIVYVGTIFMLGVRIRDYFNLS
jgi:hypothetical protein